MLKRIIRFIRNIILFFLISSIAATLLYRYISPPITPLMLLRIAGQLSRGDKIELKKKWIPFEKISPSVVLAVVVAEDPKFKDHSGFDIEAIKKAYQHNRKSGNIRGGSTISQQTAKNIFLLPCRSWIRKALEAYFTVLIELFWSKRRIIEIYLNVAEMGKNIYGIEKASRVYFSKSAMGLSMYEAALIAAILPNPVKWNPNKPTRRVHRRHAWILMQMHKRGKVKL